MAKHGHHTGWRTSERIFFTSLARRGWLSCRPRPTPSTTAYINADDDDGNLLNGTPNAQEIFDALDLHGMATGLFPTSPACARPAQPVLTVTPQCGSFDLSWSADRRHRPLRDLPCTEVTRGHRASSPIAEVPSIADDSLPTRRSHPASTTGTW